MAVDDLYASHPNHTAGLVLHLTDSKQDLVSAASAGNVLPISFTPYLFKITCSRLQELNFRNKTSRELHSLCSCKDFGYEVIKRMNHSLAKTPLIPHYCMYFLTSVWAISPNMGYTQANLYLQVQNFQVPISCAQACPVTEKAHHQWLKFYPYPWEKRFTAMWSNSYICIFYRLSGEFG